MSRELEDMTQTGRKYFQKTYDKEHLITIQNIQRTLKTQQ